MDPHINPANNQWDDNYFEHVGKFLTGGDAGGGGQPAFSFDYEQAAKDAYGELGPYYNNLLLRSQGDVNKAMARLVEDYTTGNRYKEQDASLAQDQVNTNEKASRKNIIDSALSRGLFQKSASDTNTGADYGIPDANLAEDASLRNRQRADISTALTRFKETAATNKARSEVDIPEKEKYYEADLEQQKRQEAGQLANLKGDQAYQKFQSSLF